MKILLTGPTGQVGSALAATLGSLGEIVEADRATLDLSDPDSIRRTVRQVRPQVIVNAAAYTAVDRAESEQATAMAINGVAPGILAEEAKRIEALLVHYSTDYVFDGASPFAYKEDDATNPLNVYGKTKLEGESRIAAAGCRHLVLRTSWVYADRGKNFLLTMLRLGRERAQLRVVDDQIGAPTSAAMLARATVDALRVMGTRSSLDGLYHATAAGSTSWCGFARAILRGADIDTEVVAILSGEYVAAARRPRNSVLDNSRLNAQFRIHLPRWEEGMLQVLDALGERRR